MTVASTASGVGVFSPAWLSRTERGASLCASTAALALLLVAASLSPSPAGIGTHQQLGLPPCTWPVAFGVVCPACGMTTAFAHAARGDLLSSFVTQPFGAILAIATAMVVVLGAYGAVTGTRVFMLFRPLATKWGAALFVTLLFAAWGYKILDFRGLIG